MMKKQNLIEKIQNAFHGVKRPHEITLHVAEAHDNSDYDHDSEHRKKDHQGPWQTLPQEHLLFCQNALPHLDAEGMPYYLPAFMCWTVENYNSSKASLIDATIYALGTTTEKLKSYQDMQFSLFTENQKQACVDFLQYLLEVDPNGTFVDSQQIRKALERRWKV